MDKNEIRELRQFPNFVTHCAALSLSAEVVSEDLYAGLLNITDEEGWVKHWELLDNAEYSEIVAPPSAEELVERIDGERTGDFDTWDYISPFSYEKDALGDVYKALFARYIEEGEKMLNRVREELVRISRRFAPAEYDKEEDQIEQSHLEADKAFLPESLLDKLTEVANQGLGIQKKRPTSSTGMIAMILLHVLCWSYKESRPTVCVPGRPENFYRSAYLSNDTRKSGQP